MSVSNKTELRLKYKEIRGRLSGTEKSGLDAGLTRRVLDSPEYKNAETIFAFISKDIEVDTSVIIADAFSKGKRVAVPRCNSDGETLTFYYINSADDLTQGTFGLLEPDAERCGEAAAESADIVFVPGLAYDRRGYRIGFGKGYYDRYLSDKSVTAVGLCYSNCVADELPIDEHDLPVDCLITDSFTIYTRRD